MHAVVSLYGIVNRCRLPRALATRFYKPNRRAILLTDSSGHPKCGNMLNISECAHSTAAVLYMEFVTYYQREKKMCVLLFEVMCRKTERTFL